MLLFSIVPVTEKGQNLFIGLNKNNTDAGKGLLAVAVLLSHLAGHTSYHLPFFSFTVFGSIGVGCFFFLSGYGLIKTSRKKDYFKGYLSKHISKLFVPYFILIITWLIVFQVILKEPLSRLFHSFATGNPVSNSWYFFASLYCYILFWTGRNKPFSQMQLVVFIGIVIWIFILAIILKWPDWWYKTIICFYFGIVWGRYSKRISSFIQYNYVLVVSFSVLAVIAAYTLPMWAGKMIKGNLIWLLNDVALVISGVLFMAIILEIVSVRNIISTFLGKISFCMYLIHGLIIQLTDTIIPKWGTTDTPMFKQELVSLMVFLVSVVFSLIMTGLIDKIKQYKRLERVF